MAMQQKKIYLQLLFRQWQESIDIFNTHTGNFGFKVPALANLLVLGGRISQYIPPFGGYNITWVMDSFKQFDKTLQKLQVSLVDDCLI